MKTRGDLLSGRMSDPKRILLLSEPYPPRNPGGAGQYAHCLARGLVQRGHQVEVVCVDPSLNAVEEIDGVRVTRIRTTDYGWTAQTYMERAASVLPRLLALHSSDSFDVVHDVGGFLYTEVFRRFTRQTGIPGVTHLLLIMRAYLEAAGHRGFPLRFFHDLQVWQCEASARVITSSAADRGLYRQWFGQAVPADTLIANGVEQRRPVAGSVERWREALSPDGAVLLFCGGRRRDPVKGADRAVSLAAALRRAGIRIRMVGTDLAASDREAGIRPPIRSLGRLAPSDLITVLAACDVVLCPSRYESFGLLALEAISLGTPVLAARTGGHLGTIRGRRQGLLLDETEWDSPGAGLVEFVRRAARHRSRRRTRAIPAEFSLARALDSIEELYGGLFAGARGVT